MVKVCKCGADLTGTGQDVFAGRCAVRRVVTEEMVGLFVDGMFLNNTYPKEGIEYRLRFCSYTCVACGEEVKK